MPAADMCKCALACDAIKTVNGPLVKVAQADRFEFLVGFFSEISILI